MHLFRLMWKNALRNSRRTVLTISSIAVCIFLISTLQAVLASIYRVGSGSRNSHLRLIVHRATGVTQPLPISYRQKIAAVPGVKAVVYAREHLRRVLRMAPFERYQRLLCAIQHRGYEVLLGDIYRHDHSLAFDPLINLAPVHALELFALVSTLTHGDTSNVSGVYICKLSTCVPSYEGPLSFSIADYGLNNLVEQDHRAVKQIVRPMLGFKSFRSARRRFRMATTTK